MHGYVLSWNGIVPVLYDILVFCVAPESYILRHLLMLCAVGPRW